MSESGWVTLGSSGRMKTMDLVDWLRKFRGRVTRKALCRALGHPNNETVYKIVTRLCSEYGIPVASGKSIASIAHRDRSAAQRERRLREDATRALPQAKQDLAEQIRLAKMEQATAPLYRMAERKGE